MAAKAKSDPFADGTEETAVDVAHGREHVTEVSITLKGGRDFDAPWCVIRADSTQAALDAMDETMQELLKAAAKYGKAFAALGAEGRSTGSGASRPTPGPKEHPDGKKEFCQHGEMDYKSGVTKSGKNQGKVWHAFDCSEGVCDRKWLND